MFTGATVYFALARVPRWRTMQVRTFLPDFARVIKVADKVQPFFLVVTIASAALFVSSTEGTADLLGGAAIAGFAVTMLASLGVLVPLQRRMIKLGPDPAQRIEAMRERWLKGHLGRASLATLSFVLLVAAVLTAS
jgi:hypothetical protein